MKINSKRQSPVWPYLGILACLFVLSITAPRAWDRMGRQETLSQVLSARKAPTSVFFDQKSVSPEKLDATELQAQTAAVDDELLMPEEPAGPMEPPLAEPQPEGQLEGPLVPPAPVIVQEVRQDIDVANRPSLPADEPIMDVPEPPAEPEIKPAPASSVWPLPRLLNEQLTQLADADPSAAWANGAINLIQQLCQTRIEEGGARDHILQELRKLAGGNAPTAHGNSRLETQVARARYTLARWLDVWEGAADLDKVPRVKDSPKMSAQRIDVCLADVESLARQGAPGNGWREYLKLESLRQLTAESHSDLERREAARKVLDRMASTRLTKSQLKFAGEGPLAALHTQLRAWAAEPVTAAQLLTHLEQYEHTGLASDARLLAGDFRALSWSAPLEAEKISRHLDAHYRNANVRIAMTGALLNRLLPQPEKIVAPVRDTVINVPVYGSSTTSTKLSVRLVPDPNRIRLGIEGAGLVASDTVATSGPATFRSQGRSNFLVRKLVVIGPHGMSVWPAVAEAENNYNYLTSLETEFDGVPLVGSLVRNVARSKHEQSQGEARLEVEQKVARRARTELDEQVRPHLVKAAENIQQKEMALLDRLGLEVTPVEFSTTPERIVARVRLGTPEQLGAHTPRPRAPSDSWYSLQVHESALNNAMEQLNLNGRKFELPELFTWIAKKLDRPQMAKLDDLPDDVHLTFAAEDAVRVRCEAGRLEVILSFAQLTQGRSHWHDFTVRTFYRPEPSRPDAQFVRDGTIFLEGRSLKGKPQVMLRTIFSKVLSVNRPITMLGDKITGDPRMHDLAITQFAVEDGWIALAYSPPRAPANVVRRPK